uniref:GNAT family N-acetyltransferase n=1 Tax=Candidatus Enterococcus willemsii TaxID=1857215 RepID=UPI00403F8C85
MQLIPVKENELADVLIIQKQAFQKLYDTYQDDQTSPYTQTLERLQEKYQQSNNYFFFIVTNEIIGYIRVVIENNHARIAPIAVLPDKENQGFGSQALQLVEQTFPTINIWQLSTISQEKKLVHFYRKAGYIQQENTNKIQENMTITFFTKEILSKS